MCATRIYFPRTRMAQVQMSPGSTRMAHVQLSPEILSVAAVGSQLCMKKNSEALAAYGESTRE